MIRRVLILSLITLCIQGLRAQSLLHSRPLDYNPGFAGLRTHDRLSFNINQLSTASRDLYFSYDRLVKPLAGGIGIYGQQQSLRSADGASGETHHECSKIGVVYSPKYIVKRQLSVSPSLDVAGSHHFYERTEQVSEVASLLLTRESKLIVRGRAGLLINSSSWYTGYYVTGYSGGVSRFHHDVQAGYIQSVCPTQNLIVDARMQFGDRPEEFMRFYREQLNLTYQWGFAFFGAGWNDFSSFSAMGGVKLTNLKISAAYHMLEPSAFSNVEIGVQYVFDPDNDEKVVLPFRRWWLNMKK